MASALEQAFSVVQSLAEDFEANKTHFLSPTYQESEVRKDFIDKFLTALSWDVNHYRQKTPFEQEVKVERGECPRLATPAPIMSDLEIGKRALMFFVIMAIGLALTSVVPPLVALLIWVVAAVLGIRVLAKGKIKS